MPTKAQRAAAVSKREAPPAPSSAKRAEVRSPAAATVLSNLSRTSSSEGVGSRLLTPTVASRNAIQSKRDLSSEPAKTRSSTMNVFGRGRAEPSTPTADTKTRSQTLRDSSSGLGGAPTAASINARLAKREGVSGGSTSPGGRPAFGLKTGLPQKPMTTPSFNLTPNSSSADKAATRVKPTSTPKTIMGRAPSKDPPTPTGSADPSQASGGTLGDDFRDKEPVSRLRSNSFDKIVILTTFTALHLDNVLMHLQVINTALKLAAKRLNALMVAGDMKDFSFQWLEFQKAFYINLHIEEKRVFPLLDRVANNAISNARLRETNAEEMLAAEAITSELTKSKSIAKSTFDNWKRLFVANIDKKEPIIANAEKYLGKTFEERAVLVYKEVVCPEFVNNRSELAWTIGWCAMVLSDHVEVVDLGYFLKALQSICSPEQYALFQEKVKSNVASKQWIKLVKEYGVDASGKQTIEAPQLMPPIKEDPRFSSYFRMLKVGLPIDAAAIKMTNEQAAATYEDALEILSLNPDDPVPMKFLSNSAKEATPPSKPRSAVAVGATSVPCLYFTQFMRDGLRLAMDLLSSYLADGNTKDFSFLWEEYLKAFLIYNDLNSRFFFPAVVMLSGVAFSSLEMSKERDRQNVLTNEIKGDLRKNVKVNSIIFENWIKVTQEIFNAEANLFHSVEPELGDSVDERARVVSEEMLSPALGGSKNDFTWCLGWCAMILDQFSVNSAATEKLGHLMICLQNVCSPNQYELLQERVKKGVEHKRWSKVVMDYALNGMGKQAEPEYQKPSLRDDPRFLKFFKMMKVGLSMEAAANQMVQEKRASDFSIALKVLQLDPNDPLPDDLESNF